MKLLPFLTAVFMGSHLSCSATTVRIDPNENFQKIEGFGSCLVTFTDFPEEYKDKQFLDRVVNDLGLSIIRIPIMEHTEWVNDDEDPDHFNWAGFYMKDNCNRKGIQSSMELLQEFKKRGITRFMASPWSPPQFMKTNRSPVRGGFLRADMTAEFAEYLAAYIILAKQNWDIDLGWVSLQNESIFPEPYRSCLYHSFAMREAVRAVMRKFKKEGIQTKLLINEDMLYTDRVLHGILPTMQDEETRLFDGHFAVHRFAEKEGLQKWAEQSSAYQRESWMTETSGHQTHWAGAMKMGQDIHNHLVFGNFSAWLYWQLSGPESVYSIMTDGKPTHKYNVSKHFFRYIRPGAIRIAANSDEENVLVSAYKHEEEKTLTIVALNLDSVPKQVNIELADSAHITSSHFNLFISTEESGWQELGQISQNPHKILLPPYSIATLWGVNEADSQLRSINRDHREFQSFATSGMTTQRLGSFEPLPFKRDWQLNPTRDIDLMNYLKSLKGSQTIHSKRANGWTLLHDATLTGNYDAVSFLIKEGVDVTCAANDGWTALHASTAAFLSAKSETHSKHELVSLLLDAGADPNASTDDGWTPLHAASANAYCGWRQNVNDPIRIIENLIQSSADLEAKDVNDRTPLHWAAWQGYPVFKPLSATEPEEGLVISGAVVDCLIKAGADKNAQDIYGRTPLHYASEMGYAPIVYQLLKSDVDVTIRDIEGENALDIVKRRKDLILLRVFETIQLPKEYQTYQTPVDSTAQHLGPELLDAAWQGDIEKVKTLLEEGADKTFVDHDGFKAIDRARDSGYQEIVELLSTED